MEITKIISINAEDKKPVSLPEGFPLSIAEFEIDGRDLVMTGPDECRLVVTDYYTGDNPPDLVSPDGAELSCAMIALLLKPSGPKLPDAETKTGTKSQPTEKIEGAGDIEFDPFIGIVGGTPSAKTKVTSAELLPEKLIEQKHGNAEGLTDPRKEVFDHGKSQRIIDAAIQDGMNKAQIILDIDDDNPIDDGVLILREGGDYLFGRDDAAISDDGQNFSALIQLFENEFSAVSTADRAFGDADAGINDNETIRSTHNNIICGGMGIDVLLSAQ